MIPSVLGILVLFAGIGLVYLGVHGAPWLRVYPAQPGARASGGVTPVQ